MSSLLHITFGSYNGNVSKYEGRQKVLGLISFPKSEHHFLECIVYFFFDFNFKLLICSIFTLIFLICFRSLTMLTESLNFQMLASGLSWNSNFIERKLQR